MCVERLLILFVFFCSLARRVCFHAYQGCPNKNIPSLGFLPKFCNIIKEYIQTHTNKLHKEMACYNLLQEKKQNEIRAPYIGGCSNICIPLRPSEVPLKCVLVILRAQKGRKSVFFVKNGGSRSMISIKNYFDRLYW